MSDFLSQDDIDALLNNLSDGSGGGDGGGGDDKRYKTMTPVLELFCKQASSVLSTAVFKTTDAVLVSCAKADYAAAKEKLGGDVLSLTLPLATGLTGDMYLLLRKSDAAVMADLMMGADGNAPYSDETPDALSELFNQVMGAYATALGGDLGESVSAGNVTVAPFDMDNPPYKADTVDMVLATLKVEGKFESHAALLIPTALGDAIIDKKTPKSSAGGMEMSVGISQDEMDALTQMTASSFGSAGGGSSSFGAPSSYAPPPPPQHRSSYDGPKENIDLLLDVELEVIIELGKSELSIKKILELAPGSIVELDRMAGEPVDLIVNNKIVARGEVVVVDENFGIRVVSLVSAEDRIKTLK